MFTASLSTGAVHVGGGIRKATGAGAGAVPAAKAVFRLRMSITGMDVVLVGGLEKKKKTYIGNNHPNGLSYFSDGFSQPPTSVS